jgi:hypothetical protein
MRKLLMSLLVAAFLPIYLLAALLPARRTKLVWGTTPIISNKYWSEAMKAGGHDSVTLMEGWFKAVNSRSDFDLYFEDLPPAFLPHKARMAFGICLALLYALRRAKVVHIPFYGFALTGTWLWRIEAPLFRLAGVKVIVLPFGGDFYRYSKLIDTSLRYGLLASYPQLQRQEAIIDARVAYWSRRADAVVAGFQVDGLGRWDVTLPQMFTIDTARWVANQAYSPHDGRSGPVKVMHTPNHRGFKGTEFLVNAVETLRSEGLQVELVLLEGVPNEEVRRLMGEVDILGEQFLFTGYALSGIEGMASGLPVMANLEHEAYTKVFRRYGFLDECPVLSTSPETLAEHLRLLVTRPDLREALGRAGAHYVEKYHSAEAARFLFGAIYDRLDGAQVDLINLYHPLKSAHWKAQPKVEHPLVRNLYPAAAAPPC